MIFKSTYEPNLKRIKVKIDLFYISIDDYETNFFTKFFTKLEEISKKSKVNKEDIKFYKESVEVGEYGRMEDRLIFYYEKDESDDEYTKRIEKLIVEDLKDSINEVSRFLGCVRQKKELGALYSKYVINGNWKGLKNDLFEQFLSDESAEEKIQKAYEAGHREAKKEYDESTKKIRKMLDFCHMAYPRKT